MRTLPLICIANLASTLAYGQIGKIVNTPSLSLPAKPGSIQGLGGHISIAGNKGNAQYSYSVPALGWTKIEPKLSINYSSGSGAGVLGQGFELNIDSVKRINRFGVPNGATGLHKTGIGDLTEVSKGVFRPKLEKSFAEYRMVDNVLIHKDSSGTLHRYGEVDSQREHSGDYIYRWNLSSTTDEAGNKAEYSYFSDGNINYIKAIKLIAKDGLQHYQINFSYLDRDIPSYSYANGFRQDHRKALTSIEGVRLEPSGSQRRVYRIEFDYKTNQRGTGRLLLEGIRRYGQTNDNSYPSVFLKYSPITDFSGVQKRSIDFKEGIGVSGREMKMFDFNGDSLLDFVFKSDFPENKWAIFYNKGTQNKTGEVIYEKYTLPDQHQHVDFLKEKSIADINGDQLLDVVHANKSDKLEGFLNINEDVSYRGFWDTQKPFPINGFFESDVSLFTRWVDLDADGRSEVLKLEDGKRYDLYELEKIGDKELTFKEAHNYNYDEIPLTFPEKGKFADINGDGLPELWDVTQHEFKFDKPLLEFFQNHGAKPFFPSLHHKNILAIPIILKGTETVSEPAQNDLVDIDGDSMPELVVGNKHEILIYTLKDGKYVLVSDTNKICMEDPFDEVHEVFFGDINGNGSTDIVYGCLSNATTLFYLDFYQDAEVAAPYILTNVTTSTGKRTTFHYRSSRESYVEGMTSGRMPMTFPILESTTTTVPTLKRSGGFAPQKVKDVKLVHKAGVYDFAERLFLGFHQVDKTTFHTDNRSKGLKTSQVFENMNAKLDGRLVSETIRDIGDGFVYRDSKFRYKVPQLVADTELWFPHRSYEQSIAYERSGGSRAKSREFYYSFTNRGLLNDSTIVEYLKPGEVYRKAKTIYQRKALGDWSLNLPAQNLILDSSDKVIEGTKLDYLANSARVGTVSRHDGTSWQQQFSYSYNDFGSIRSIADAMGHQTWIDYSGGGQFLPSLISRKANGVTHKKSATYDLSLGGKITSITDENGHTSKFGYDGLGRIASIQPPRSSKPTTTYSYQWGTDARYSTIVETLDGVAKPTTQYFDALGRLRGVQSPSETGTVVNGYKEFDLGGRATVTSLPLAFTDAGLYEGLSDHAQQRLTATDFDPMSRAVRAVYPNGGVARWEYRTGSQIHYSAENEPTVTYFDALDRLCAIDRWNVASLKGGKVPEDELKRACGTIPHKINDFSSSISRTELSYDPLDNIRVLTTTGKPPRYYDYDGLGRLTSFHANDLGYRNWYYDSLDRIHTTHVFNGDYKPISTMFSQFDELGRTSEQRSLLGRAGDIGKDWEKATLEFQQLFDQNPSNTPEKLAPAENLVGRLAALRLPTGYSYFYSYDAHGNRTVESLSGNKQTVSMSFGYDQLDRASRIVYPDNRSIEIAYSKKTGAEQGTWGAIDTFVNYSPLMQVAGLKAGQLQQNYQFDALTDRLTKLDANFSGSSVAKYSYDGYDKVTRLTSFTGEDVVAETIRKSFKYDLKGQLSQSNIAFKPRDGVAINESNDYRYNAAGEILQNEGRGLSYERTANGLITKITHGKKTYAFDKLGRLTTSQDNARIVWNAAGRVQTIDGKASKSEFHYLPDNTRYLEVKEVEGKTETKLIFNAFAEKQLETGEVTDYYFAAGRRVASQKTGKEVEVYLTDMLDSTRMTLDHKGEVVHYSEYRPFGSTLYEKNRAKSPRHRFAGAIFDQETGLYQMGARYYQPSLGRFISPDPLMMLDQVSCVAGGTQCTDLWSYTSNDPINKFDPSGYTEAMGHDQHSEQEAREREPGSRNREVSEAHDRESEARDRHREVEEKVASQTVNQEQGLEDDDITFEVLGTIGGVVLGGPAGGLAGGLLGKTVKTYGPRIVTKATTKLRGYFARLYKPAKAMCFVAGTMVLTPDGYAKIEDIEIGDLVVSRDEHTGITSYKEVVNLFESQSTEVINLTFVKADGSTEYINTTYEHPFFVKESGWIKAGELQDGSSIETIDGLSILASKSVSYSSQIVYNFEVADYHTYFVGDDGYLVHNSCKKLGSGGGKRAGRAFTSKVKNEVIDANKLQNNGKSICEGCGIETVKASKSIKGVRPPDNETQVDHIMPRSLGGNGDFSNGQVLCRSCNIRKGNKWP